MSVDSRIQAIAVIFATLLSMFAAYRSIRKANREQTERIAQDKQETYNRGVIDGKTSRDDEVRQLTFERDDARHERNRANVRADDFEARWRDSLERRGP